MKPLLRIWWPSLAYAAFIFVLSSLERPPFLADFDLNDKWKHFLLYAAFAVLVFRSASVSVARRAAAVWMTIVLVSAYGVTDELHQRFVPGRSCDWRDWLADTAAAMAVSVVLARSRSFRAGGR